MFGNLTFCLGLAKGSLSLKKNRLDTGLKDMPAGECDLMVSISDDWTPWPVQWGCEKHRSVSHASHVMDGSRDDLLTTTGLLSIPFQIP